MAVQEHASVDILAASGHGILPYGHRVLSESLPEPQAVYLVERRLPAAPGVLHGGNRASSPLGLAILLVFCDMDGLHRNLDNWGGIHQGGVAG